ncbi:T9SS type B sorting domain-containing protein [Chryseobacterium salivictor]|uniref:IgGFc-binding protein N-terminal domain-containing protein n=1 Tax=Chryseobacterium salivictor TaxID=2547600 RepID=A0A4P6ZEW0_9FLAO|nr:gliding motility-associated C-terminal domain-containing protein [Chryseobacterium salivictor]QBO58121.1 hypothetical protein NBC122_01294 [Chryseobacterium salivictor]
MKKLLLFLFSFIFFISFAQLDREHWFAPMVDRVRNTSQYQSIYLSTNETTPFKVDIYHNNIVVASVNISKNNPVKYSIPNAQRNRIITTNQSDLFTPVAMGLYLKGDKPFFATLRFSVTNHGEIQTSKGTAGLGTEFRAVMAPITVKNAILNFMNSIMATEDNTKVTITDFESSVKFSDGINRSQITFTLNKGQSYIIDGTGAYEDNYTGYIGAKIVSDKPIVIANGNFNGQYAGDLSNSSDILMDQGVPVDKLGQEFVLMKGNGETSSNMEKAIILATENNTEIYINNGAAPVVTLNAGQYYTTDNNAYIEQAYGHFNMYIKATKNVYIYQLLAGARTASEATGGFNYIPPLNCYLPKKIDEIGKINENEYSSNNVNYSLTVPTKLNIITETGASLDVKSNGVSLILNASNGPFDVSGNNTWVTYSIPNITGNIAIYSSKAVTAGISAGNDAVGYGGYFAGFSSIPLITKTEGDCLPDVKLEVTEGFDRYEWLQKVGTIYVPAPGVNNTFVYIPTQAGIYAVKVKQGSCDEIQTRDFKFYNCTTFTNYDFTTCTSQDITPIFVLSSQTINTPTLTINTPPTKGTAVINADGTITYTANPNATGTDTFKFSFCGNGDIPDCEILQATINLNQIATSNVILKKCSSINSAVFNLNDAVVTPDATAQKTYYSDAGLQNLIPNNQLANYPGKEGDFIYVYIKNSFGCDAVATITLAIDSPPVINENLYTKNHCDEDVDGIIDGKYSVNVNSITPVVIQNNTGLTIRYYENEMKAITGGSDNITGVYVFSTAYHEVWIRVDTLGDCPPTVKKIVLNIGTKLNINNAVSDFACDNDLDNEVNINLASYIALFSTDSTVAATYFDDLTKAQNNFAGENINANQIIKGNKIFYFRLKKQGFCDAIGTLNLNLRQPKISAVLKDKKICPDAKTSLDAGSGFDRYLWSTGEKTQVIQNVPINDYWVDLYSNGCIYRQNVSITAIALPQITRIDIQGSIVSVNVNGGNPPYQYAIDNLNYQSSNVFLNVRGGDHTISVISADNCTPVSVDINVIQLYNAITPNDDGINDVLNYSGLLKKNEPSLQIYNRSGQTIFSGDKNNRFSWNGKFAGRAVNTGTYWYVMSWKEPGHETLTQYSGWVLVKIRE